MFYENVIESDDIHSTVFVYLDVHFIARAVVTVADERKEINDRREKCGMFTEMIENNYAIPRFSKIYITNIIT